MLLLLRFFSIQIVGFRMVSEFMKAMFSLIRFFPVVFSKKKLFLSIFQIVFMCLMMGLASISSGCKSNSSFDDPFYLIYKPAILNSSSYQSKSSVFVKDTLSFSAHNCSLSLLSRVISDRFKIGLVFSDSLSKKTVTAEFKDTSLTDVISVISRQLDTDTLKIGNTYFVGKLRPEDRGILVRKVLGISNDDLQKACNGLLSSKGKLSVVGSGIVVVSDLQSILIRASELLDYLSSIRECVWILQLAFLTINKDIVLEGGLKITTSGTVAYNVSDNEFKLKDLNIDGIVNAAMRSSFADVHSCPMVLIREGSISEWKYGKKIPIPRRTVSDAGTVTTSGYDFVDVGFNLRASIQRSHIGGLLSLQIGKSEVESYVDLAPVVAQNTYNFTCDMVSLRPYLLGELKTFTDLNTQSDILNFGKTRGKSSVQIWGQLYPIQPGTTRSCPLGASK